MHACHESKGAILKKMYKALPIDKLIILSDKNERISNENDYENEQECLIHNMSLFPQEMLLYVPY